MTPRGRVPRDLPLFAVAAALLAFHQPTFHAQSYQDLLPELAARIAAAVAPVDRIALTTADAGADPSLGPELTRALAVRGVLVVDRSSAGAFVTYACAENIRQRVCAAEVRKDNVRYTVVADRPFEVRAPATMVSPIVSMQPLFAQAAPILDLALAGSRLVVLDPTAVSIHERTGDGWQRTRTQPIVSPRPWPRDARGRLKIDGSTLEIFLPGLTCRGSSESLLVACVEETPPWPLEFAGARMAAGRNVFDAPEQPFFSVAPLGADAGARWLIASVDRRFVFLDENRRALESIAADPWGDDVAAVATTCAAGTHVFATSSRARTNAQTLQAVRIAGRRLIPLTPPVILPGVITALWPTPDATRALVVARHGARGTYEAFYAAVSCGR